MTKRFAPLVYGCLLWALCALRGVAAQPLLPDTVGVPPDTTTPAPPRGETIRDTIHYSAAHIHYDIEERVLLLWENARARYRNITLTADTIVYRADDNLFEAWGYPQLIEDRDTTVGEFLAYNIKTRRGSIRYATTRVGDDYFTGHRIVKSEENHLYILDGDYTTCAYLDDPHFSIYGRAIKILPNDKAISRPVVLTIGSAPILVFPYYVMPLERGRSSGWLQPGWGGNPSRGGYLDNIGYYWAPNDYADFKLAAKVEEFENFVLSAATRYRLRYWITAGSINARYALGTHYRGRSREWSVDYQHNQNLTPDGHFTLRGGGTLTSSKREEKTFFQSHSDIEREILRQRVRADMSLAKRFPALNASANLSVSRDHDLITERIDDNLPSFTFSLPDRPLIPPNRDRAGTNEGEDPDAWYNKLYYGFNSRTMVQRTSWGNDSLPELYRPGTTQNFNLRYNHKLFEHITFSPFFRTRLSTFYGYTSSDTVGYTYQWDTLRTEVRFVEQDSVEFVRVHRREYDEYRIRDDRTGLPLIDTLVRFNADGDSIVTYRVKHVPLVPDSFPRYDTTDNRFASDYVWDAGVSMSTNLYGTFGVRLFSLTGIRHTLTPSLSYTFVPEHTQEKLFHRVPGIESSRAAPRRQLVRIGIDNLFQGRVTTRPPKEGERPGSRTFRLFNAGFNATYDFEAPERKWSDLSVSAATKLPIAGISYTSNWWLYDAGDQFSYPLLRSYTVGITPNNFSASGSLWGGDHLVLEGLNPRDPVEYATAGMQQWSLSLNPSFSYSASRATPADIFVPRKNFGLSASGRVAITRNWSTQWSSRYNFTTNRFDSHTLSFRANLECWDLLFDWRPSGLAPGYYFRVNVKKIPEIKWEERR